jgi:hypothetical protein
MDLAGMMHNTDLTVADKDPGNQVYQEARLALGGGP